MLGFTLVYVGFYFILFVFMGGGEGMHGMCVTVLYALACDH